VPEVDSNFSTNIPGLFIVGDLTGTPHLKFAVDSGTRVVRSMDGDPQLSADGRLPLVIIGAGVSGLAASIEAKRLGIEHRLLESGRLLETLENFPVGKPIFTCPTEMKPAGELQFPEGDLDREGLLESLHQQVKEAGVTPICARVERVVRHEGALKVICQQGESFEAMRVVIAIGRGGDHRQLGVAGEELDHVSHRMHDPAAHRGESVVVVGGGNSACETAVALADAGAAVTLSHRSDQLVRPAQHILDLVEDRRRAQQIQVEAASEVIQIDAEQVTLRTADGIRSVSASTVYTMIGREAPLAFLRRCGVKIRGEWTVRSWLGLLAVLTICTLLFHWKSAVDWFPVADWWRSQGGFPAGVDRWWAGLGGAFADSTTLAGALASSVGEAGFWYSLAYTLVILIFGIRRIRRRRTAYVKWQTWTLISIQALPLFLLPYLFLPWLGHLGYFDAGWGKTVADALFPEVQGYAPGREYWRCFGLILAWPLFFWNVFTAEPLTTWLVISLVQTFVVLPLAIRRWGKGVYCGWICSCGALAETLDAVADIGLVSVMLANNETGVVNPVVEVAALVAERAPGAVFHTDAVQGTAWLDLAERCRGAHLVSITGHKFGGPKGAGALLVVGDVSLAPMLRGGGQERARRSGTQNVPAIVGLGRAADLVELDWLAISMKASMAVRAIPRAFAAFVDQMLTMTKRRLNSGPVS